MEITEALGARAAGLSRLDLLALLWRVMQEGVQAVEKAEQTVSFEEAARRPLRAWTVSDCKRLLEKTFPNSTSSYRKGRAILNSIFMYGLRQEWCDKNPVQGVENPRVTERPIAALTIDEVKRLEQAAARPRHRDMALSLRLMLYCGVRPAEISRIDPQRDIVGDELIIRPQNSKTGGGRVIPLRKVKNYLRTHPQQKIIPRNWQNRWHDLRQAADFSACRADVCRHTFATYHARYFRNLPALQLEMGHRDLGLLRTRYISLTCGRCADYWK